MTELVLLPIVAGGVGAGVATAQLQAKKTIQATGLSGTVIVEASNDGGTTWCQVASFSPATEDQVITVAAAMMRVNAQNGSADMLQVVAERGLVRAGALPAAPAGSPGVALDVTDFGCLTTVIVGNYSGPGALNIEVSGDGVEWSTIASFSGNGCQTFDASAKFMRVNSDGSTADISVASEEPAISALTQPSAGQIVWAPDDPNGDRGNIYTGQGEAGFAAVDAAVESALNNGVEKVTVKFVSRFSTVLDNLGRPACEIPTSANQPGGKWFNYDGDIWWTSQVDEITGSVITFADGAQINLGRNSLNIEGQGLDIINDEPANTPFDQINQTGVSCLGGRTNMYNTVGTAAPMFRAAPGAGFADFMFLFFDSNMLGGFGQRGLGTTVALPAPVVDIGGNYVAGLYNGGIFEDNAFTDSNNATGFSGLQFDIYGPIAFGDQGQSNFTFPALGEIGSGPGFSPILHRCQGQLMQFHVGPRSFFYPPAPLITADDTQMSHGQVLFFDTTAGDVAARAPYANPATGLMFVVCNEVGANNVVLEPFGGAGAGNVRNTGGVDDLVNGGATDSVPAGTTHIYMTDGGNGAGQGVGNSKLVAVA